MMTTKMTVAVVAEEVPDNAFRSKGEASGALRGRVVAVEVRDGERSLLACSDGMEGVLDRQLGKILPDYLLPWDVLLPYSYHVALGDCECLFRWTLLGEALFRIQ
jgi:hypothetical protein